MCHIGTCMCIVPSNEYCPRQSCLQDLEEDQHRTHGHREGSQRGYVVLLAGTRQEHRGHDAVGEHILEVHHRALGGFRFQVSGFRFQVSGFRFQVSGFRFQVSGFRDQFHPANVSFVQDTTLHGGEVCWVCLFCALHSFPQ